MSRLGSTAKKGILLYGPPGCSKTLSAQAMATEVGFNFFDEIESIGGKRENGGRNNGVNVLTTLLNEMDGIETLKGVMVLAATNQPQALDAALLRPGRFDKLLYVAPPDLKGRKEILQARKRTMDLADDVDTDVL